ncbi:MAG: GNAT family N-acetyltransferase, partial [Anaerolineaceae bacterium]|nr:GNAT family N-acetyltransferase [Anaerolineaceae bacterium]
MPPTNPLHTIDPQDPRWFKFIEAQPDAVIFHHPAWIGVLAQTYKYHPFILAHCNDNGEILAGLPVMEVNSRLTGRRWVSLPFSDYCQPLAISDNALQAFTDRLIILGSQPEVPRIELRWQFPPKHEISTYSPHVLHLHHLDPDFAVVQNNIHKRMRKYIRRAERNDLRVEFGTKLQDMRKFYQLQLETRRRHGLPIQPRKFFDLLGSQVLDKGLGFVIIAYQNERMLAGLVLLHYQQTMTKKYGADTRNYGKLQPNYILDMTALRWAHKNGFKTIDYGRSAIDNIGLRKYKSRFGATEIPLHYGVIGGAPPTGTDTKLMG